MFILMRAIDYASFKMLMNINGNDHKGICIFIMFCRNEFFFKELNFLKKRKVTYVT